MWDAQAAAFSKHFRVLRYDTRGHGESEAPHGAYGLDRLGRDVASPAAPERGQRPCSVPAL